MSITLSEENGEEYITTTSSIPEDANEGSLRPRMLSDYIGQQKAKGNLEIFMCSLRGLRGLERLPSRQSLPMRWE